MNLLSDGLINLQGLIEISGKPDLYAASNQKFWDDPYIAQQMMKAHLNPNHDAASRQPHTIQRIVNWLSGEFLKNLPGNQIIDLGCGPGLYTTRFSKAGFNVTGIDLSKNSIDYAKRSAQQEGLDIHYEEGNYLKLRAFEQFDAATLIYFDYATFKPADRTTILENVHRALKPGGFFIFDVMTKKNKFLCENEEWHTANGGFWSAEPYLCLSRNFVYEEACAMLSQHLVIESDGSYKLYRIWEHWFNIESITEELDRNNFEVIWLGSDLMGSEYTPESDSMGIVARKR